VGGKPRPEKNFIEGGKSREAMDGLALQAGNDTAAGERLLAVEGDRGSSGGEGTCLGGGRRQARLPPRLRGIRRGRVQKDYCFAMAVRPGGDMVVISVRFGKDSGPRRQDILGSEEFNWEAAKNFAEPNKIAVPIAKSFSHTFSRGDYKGPAQGAKAGMWFTFGARTERPLRRGSGKQGFARGNTDKGGPAWKGRTIHPVFSVEGAGLAKLP